MSAVSPKPYSEACERNKGPILDVLETAFANAASVLEIGSGTGQHAVHFGAVLAHLTWQTSDLPENHAGIRMWLNEAKLGNVRAPLLLNVSDDHWPVGHVDAMFTANTLHIMSWPQVGRLFTGAGRILNSGGSLCVYGPFNYNEAYTSDSNARFDAMLRNRDSQSGIRNIEDIRELGLQNGLELTADHEMPANNRLLVFYKGVRREE